MDELVLPGANINFFKEIDELFDKTGSYLDAIIHWCEKNNLEVTHITSLVSANNISIARLECDAERLHFLKPKRRIPL